MATIATNKFRIHNAKSFTEGFSEAEASNLYLFIGKYSPWTSSDTVSGAIAGTDDTSPPTPPDHNQNVENQIWRTMIAAKKIGASDVNHVIPRYNWTTGTIYTAYTDLSTTLHTDGVNPFYVMTNEFNVYKCLFTPYDAGTQTSKVSTSKPIGSSTSPITTGDGYVWKYMFTISAADALKFVTTSYIPVRTFASDPGTATCSQSDLQWLVQEAAIDGAIQVVKRTANSDANSGSGYRELAGTLPSIGSSSSTVVVSGGNAADDFYNGMTLYVTNSNKTFLVTDYVGSTTTLTVTPNVDTAESLSTFEIAPTVNLVGGDGTSFNAISKMSSGTIDSVKVLTAGTLYTTGSITFTDGTGSPGEGASYVAVIPPKDGHGKDPVDELGGFFVLMNTRLEYDEGVEYLTVDNDYRQIGVIKDPLKADSSLATDALYLQTVALPFDAGFGTFTQDETVTGGTSDATGTVVDQLDIGGTTYLRLSNVVGTFQASETVTGGTSGSTGDVAEAGPIGAELKKFSGEVVYLENRKPIPRDSSQLEDLKIILEF